MADQGKHGISWTDETWNPVVGCSIVSPACTNCYAMRQAARIERMNAAAIEAAVEKGRKPPPPTHYAGTTREVNGKPVWTGKLVLAPDHIVTAPLRWKRPRRVFVNSMSDLFHENMPDEWIDQVFAVMALSPQHTFQILTKRPERMRDYLTRDWATAARRHVEDLTLPTWSMATAAAQERLRRYTSPGFPHPLEHVWLGVTAEDQARADERIPHLLTTPAAVRFVSAEPLLEPIDFTRVGTLDSVRKAFPAAIERETRGRPTHGAGSICSAQIDAVGAPGSSITFFQTPDHMGGFRAASPRQWPRLDWVIVGGESGPGARPTHPDWVRSIRDQCTEAGVAFHFKQWGEWAPCPGASDWPYDKDYDRTTWMGEPPCIRPSEPGWSQKYCCGGGAHDPFKLAPYGGSILGTPEFLDQVARCPQSTCRTAGKCVGNARRQAMRWLGKSRAGRLLDGVIHDAFPEARQ